MSTRSGLPVGGGSRGSPWLKGGGSVVGIYDFPPKVARFDNVREKSLNFESVRSGRHCCWMSWFSFGLRGWRRDLLANNGICTTQLGS